MNSQLTVRRYMSPCVFSIGRSQPLVRAHELMREHAIRHLPVLEGGTLIGLVSQRDLLLIEALPDVDPRRISVEEAMSTEVFAVDSDTPLAEVAATMAERKLGCAVVMHQQHVLGVFTSVDASRALSELLRAPRVAEVPSA